MSFTFPSLTQPLATAHKPRIKPHHPTVRPPAPANPNRPPPQRIKVTAKPNFALIDNPAEVESNRFKQPDAQAGLTSTARWRPSQPGRRVGRAGWDEDEEGEAGEDPYAGKKLIKIEEKGGKTKVKVEDAFYSEEKEARRKDRHQRPAPPPMVTKNFRQRFSPPPKLIQQQLVAEADSGLFDQLELVDSKPGQLLVADSTSPPTQREPSVFEYHASSHSSPKQFISQINPHQHYHSQHSPHVYHQSLIHPQGSISSTSVSPPNPAARPPNSSHKHLNHPLNNSNNIPQYQNPHSYGYHHQYHSQPSPVYAPSPARVAYLAPARRQFSRPGPVHRLQRAHHNLAHQIQDLASQAAAIKRSIEAEEAAYWSPVEADGSSDEALYATNPRQAFQAQPTTTTPRAPIPRSVGPPARVHIPAPEEYVPELDMFRARLNRNRASTGQYTAPSGGLEHDHPHFDHDTPGPFSDPPSLSPDPQDDTVTEQQGQLTRFWTQPARPPLAQLPVQATPSRPSQGRDVFADKLKRQAGLAHPLKMHNSLALDKLDTQRDQPTIPPDDSTSTQLNDENKQPTPPPDDTRTTPPIQSATEPADDQAKVSNVPLFLDPSPSAGSPAAEAQAGPGLAEVEAEVDEAVNARMSVSPSWSIWDNPACRFEADDGFELDEQLFPELYAAAEEPNREEPSPIPTSSTKKRKPKSKSKPKSPAFSPTPEPPKKAPVVSPFSSASPQLGPAVQVAQPKTPSPSLSPVPQRPVLSPATVKRLEEQEEEDERLEALVDAMCVPSERIVPRNPLLTSTEASDALAREAEDDNDELRGKARPRKRARTKTGSSEVRSAALEELKGRRRKASSGSSRLPSSRSADKGAGRSKAGGEGGVRVFSSEREEDEKEPKRRRKRSKLDKREAKRLVKAFVDVEAEVDDDTSGEDEADEIDDEGEEG